MKLKLINRVKLISDVESFIFESESPISWQAGQFLHYTLHHEPTDERGSDRWFTISSAPFEGNPTITTRFSEKSSSFKTALQNLKIGDELEAEGPEGDFTVEDPNQTMVFIAGGIGITPFHSILKQLDHDEKALNIQLIYGNKSEDHIPFKSELEDLKEKHSEFKINYVIDPKHIDQSTIQSLVFNLQLPIFYVSGPEPMVEALGETLKGMGIPESKIKQDFFPNYPAD